MQAPFWHTCFLIMVCIYNEGTREVLSKNKKLLENTQNNEEPKKHQIKVQEHKQSMLYGSALEILPIMLNVFNVHYAQNCNRHKPSTKSQVGFKPVG